jgi:hypothetical protein
VERNKSRKGSKDDENNSRRGRTKGKISNSQ